MSYHRSIYEVLGATQAKSSPGTPLYPYGLDPNDPNWQGPMTPAQLANLNRPLTPAEQKAVDDYQSAQANAAQAAEEAKPFVNPQTGKISTMHMDFIPGAPTKSVQKLKPPTWPYWVAAGVSLAGLGVTIYLLSKARWGWAIANFLLFTPIASGSVLLLSDPSARKKLGA